MYKSIVSAVIALALLATSTTEAFAKKAKCEKVATYIHLIDYLNPEDAGGQYTPLPIAYQDYLDDLAWWHGENPNACTVKPEKITPALLKKSGRR